VAEKPIESPDRHHLLAASGWMDLGDAVEAESELQKIKASLQSHPEVLNVRWSILASAGNWIAAIDLARTIRDLTPDEALGWIHLAYALHELRRTEEALDTLQPVVERFPDCAIIPYNLACYCAQLNKLDEAREWFRRAMKTGNPGKIKAMASEDLDLKPIWQEIQTY
jgi:predicted Zn-dependent protease